MFIEFKASVHKPTTGSTGSTGKIGKGVEIRIATKCFANYSLSVPRAPRGFVSTENDSV
jgi:hypothetical protein